MADALEHFKDLTVQDDDKNQPLTLKSDGKSSNFDSHVSSIFDEHSREALLQKGVYISSRAGTKSTLVSLEHAEKLGIVEYGRFGSIIGDSNPREIALNVHEPFCLIAVGVQGSGKSHTIGTVIENCAVPSAGVVNLRSAMPVLVCYFDTSVRNPCEAASLCMPSPKLVKVLRQNGAISEEESTAEISGLGNESPTAKKTVILVSPSFFKQRKKMYEKLPRTVVLPLLFDFTRLQAAQIKILMNVQLDDRQLYVANMLSILRDYQRKDTPISYAEFKAKIFGTSLNSNQSNPLQQRFDLLDSFISETYNSRERAAGYQPMQLEDLVEPGTIVVADLTDNMLDSDTANGIFQVLLEQFRDTESSSGKLCVFDEAHKYLSASSSSLSDSIVDTVRQMRHYGIRVAISTQSPNTLPEELLELTSVAVLHRFHSIDWYRFLSKKLPLPSTGFESIQNYSAGEALVFAGQNHCDNTVGEEFDGSASSSADFQNSFKVKIRHRLTADGGISRRNNV